MNNWADEYKKQLDEGKTVTFRAFGNSMTGLIASGQSVTVEPVFGREIKAGMVVLCQVRNNDYLHLVKQIEFKGMSPRFQIGNNKGRINGWIGLDRIYGIFRNAD